MDELEKKKVNDASDKQRNNEFNPASLEGRPPNHNETSGQQKNTKTKKKINCHRGIQSASAITMALCTLAIAGITAFYTYYASEQVEEMRNAVKESKEQSRLDQRAWICIPRANFREQFDASKITKVDFITKNTGKTPALHVKYHYRTWIQYLGQKTATFETDSRGEVAYGPGDENMQTIFADKPFPQQKINLLQSGQAILFIEIKFTYFDIYNDKRPHHTCACFYYNPQTAINMSLSFCETGCSYMD